MRVRAPPRVPAARRLCAKWNGFRPHFKAVPAQVDGTMGRSASTHLPLNANEIAIYAVETRAVIHVLWGLLLIASISLVGVSITYVLLRINLRSAQKRERQLARHVATASADLRRLGERLASMEDLEGQVTSLKAQLHRAQATRATLQARTEEHEDHRATRQAA